MLDLVSSSYTSTSVGYSPIEVTRVSIKRCQVLIKQIRTKK